MQNNYNNDQLVYAGFFARLGAHVIDAVIVGILLLIVRIPLAIVGRFLPDGMLSGNVIFQYSITAIVLYFCKILYYTLLTSHDGRTFGKRAFNLKVISQDGTELTWMNVLYRESVGKFLSGIILYIGYLMIGVDDRKRALHDRLCDTCVVYEKKIKVVRTVKDVPVQPIPQKEELVHQSAPVQQGQSVHQEQQEQPVQPAQGGQLSQGAWVVSKHTKPVVGVESRTETLSRPIELKEIQEGDSQRNDETRGL